MSILIKEAICKGCGICVDLCPTNVLAINSLEKVHVVDLVKCTQCRQCEIHCPDYAIFIEIDKEEKLYV